MKAAKKCPLCGKPYKQITQYKSGEIAYKHAGAIEFGMMVWKDVCFIQTGKQVIKQPHKADSI